MKELIKFVYKQILMDSKPSDSDKSLPSNELAKQIILNLNSQEKSKTYSISQLLEIYRTKKHPNYEKFSQYIEKQLESFKSDIYQMLDNLMYLGQKMEKVDNSATQRKSIVTGYRKFILKFLDKENLMPKARKELIDYLLKNYFMYDKSICPFICELISISCDKIPETRESYEKELHSEVVEVVRFRKMSSDQAQKCCLIIHHMNLYSYFKPQDLAYIAQSNDSNYVSYFFTNKRGQLLEEVIETYIARQLPNNEGKVKKLISALNLNPFNYKELIRALSKKGLRYFINNQTIFAIDSKLSKRPDIAEYLVEILIDQKRFKEALHFINKHYLTKFYHLNPTQDRSYNKNILEKYDQFQPTEHILGARIQSYSKTSYLKLTDLKYQQSMIKFITKQNLNQEILSRIFNSPRFGIDCENTPVFNEYEQATTQIVQIAVDYKFYNVEEQCEKQIKQIYVIDLVSMSGCGLFMEWLRRLCVEYKGVIVGHTVKKDFHEFVKQIFGNEQVQIGELNFFDIAVEFKNKYKDTKSSLEYICKTVLNRNLSKFEQCSGWNNRPLRKAQLHYAALDAALTLVIYSKL